MLTAFGQLWEPGGPGPLNTPTVGQGTNGAEGQAEGMRARIWASPVDGLNPRVVQSSETVDVAIRSEMVWHS